MITADTSGSVLTYWMGKRGASISLADLDTSELLQLQTRLLDGVPCTGNRDDGAIVFSLWDTHGNLIICLQCPVSSGGSLRVHVLNVRTLSTHHCAMLHLGN